jgi:penicillin amidase
MADTVDLAVVKRDGDTVRIEGKEEKVETRTFEIRPRDADPVERTVEWTSMGPIVNSGGDYAMVMRWTGLMADDQTMDMLHSMAVSTNVEDLRTEIRSRVSIAPQNVVMADVDGAIGWTVMGTFPRRHGFTGRVPYPASENTLHYDGWLDDIPGELSPARDYLATANNKPDHPGADAIATAYLPPWRYDRIMEVLDSHEEATPADMHELHLDVQDGAAKVFLPTLLDGVSTTGPGAPCLDKLRGWDFEATTDSAEAAIWGTFQEQLLREVFKAHLDADDLSLLLDLMTSGRHPLATLEPFVDGGDLKKPVAAALDATCTALSAKLGPDASTWTWGAMHPLKLKHPFGDQSSLLSGWNMDPAPFPGTGATVAAAGYKWSDEEWKVGFMTSLRIVMPLDDLGASTFVHPGGQAGQPKSPHYRSHYDAFLAGETLPLWFDDADVDANSTHTLILNAE